MKNIIYILYFTIFIGSCKAEKSTTCDNFITYGESLHLTLNGNVKTVLIKQYIAENKFGDVKKGELRKYISTPEFENLMPEIKEIQFTKSGQIENKTTYLSNDQSKQVFQKTIIDILDNSTEENTYDLNGDLDKVKNIWKTDELIDSIKNYNSKGKIKSIEKYNYDENNEIKTITIEHKKTGSYFDTFIKNKTARIEYSYDTNKKTFSINNYNSNDELKSKFIYNKNNYLLEYYWSDDRGTLIKRGQYTYDEKNLLIQFDYYNDNGTLAAITKYEYHDFDSNENWLKRIELHNMGVSINDTFVPSEKYQPVYILEREIMYY